jgi:hypothetical protein
LPSAKRQVGCCEHEKPDGYFTANQKTFIPWTHGPFIPLLSPIVVTNLSLRGTSQTHMHLKQLFIQYADNGSDLVFVKSCSKVCDLMCLLLIKFGPTYFVVGVSAMENPKCSRGKLLCQHTIPIARTPYHFLSI